MAVHSLVIDSNRELTDAPLAASQLKNLKSIINMAGGGGEWTSSEKIEVVKKTEERIRHAFKGKRSSKPGGSIKRHYSDLDIRGILSNRLVEDSSYDAKQGVINLGKTHAISKESVKQYVKTATAISNSNPATGGFVVLGIADSESKAKNIRDTVNPDYQFVRHQTLWLVGIDWELSILDVNLDEYWSQISRIINSMKEIPKSYRTELLNSSAPAVFEDITLIVIKAPSVSEPVGFDNEYYERVGETTERVAGTRMKNFFKSF